MTREAPDRLRSPSRIVVRGTNWVGDTIISLPAAKRLRAVFPDSSITFWVKESLAPLARTAGVADEVLSFSDKSGGAVSRCLTMSHALRAGRFDMAVLFQNAFESAFTAWLARIPLRIGYPTDVRGPLLSLRVPLRKELTLRHQVWYYLAITDFLRERFAGRGPDVQAVPDCTMALDRAHVTDARDLSAGLGIDLSRPLFCLCPGSANSEAKRWSPDYFARLADLLIERMGVGVAFVGSPGERALIERIQSHMRTQGSVSLAGRTDMVTAMAIMGLSCMVISNDTGSAHLAVAASVPVLTIFGPTVAGATAPFGPTAHIVQGEAPCAPCRHFRCPRTDHLCMRSLEPSRVFGKVEEILSGQVVAKSLPGETLYQKVLRGKPF
ncbi:MAG: lipopolysaccharide heptosyltransferase II [Thermodesulfobacteriota bacterium]